MTTPYGIRTITEQSIAALLAPYATDPLFTGVQFHAGQIDEIRSVPIVIFQAESAHAHSDFGYTNLGNFEITLKIYVYTSLDDEDRKSTRLNSSHTDISRMPSSA